MRRWLVLIPLVFLAGVVGASSHCGAYGVSNCVSKGTVGSDPITLTPGSGYIVAEKAYVAEAPFQERNDWQQVSLTGGTQVDPGQSGGVRFRQGSPAVPIDALSDGRYILLLWGCPVNVADSGACGWMRPRTFEKSTSPPDSCDTSTCTWVRRGCGAGSCGPGQMQEQYSCTDGDCDDGRTRCTPSPQCSPSVNVRVNMSEATGISRSEYSSFLSYVASQLRFHGVDVTFDIVQWDTFNPDRVDCGDVGLDEMPSQEVDIVVCAAGWGTRGAGGFWGWEASKVGHNTTTFARDPEGPNEDDVHTSTHEFLHYFGISDLYGWPDAFPMRWMDSDIMSAAVWRKDPDPTLGQALSRITQFNVDRVASSSEPGRGVVAARWDQRNVYPGYMHLRISNQTDLRLDVADGQTTCRVHEMMNECVDRGPNGCNDWKRLWELGTHRGHIQDQKAEYTTDGEGVLTLEMRRFARNRGIRLRCDTASGTTTTWLPWAMLDRCFVENGMETPASCAFTCRADSERKNWCAYAGSTDIDGTAVVQKKNQLDHP